MAYRARTLLGVVSVSLLLIGCNDETETPPTYTVGGTVSGVAGNGLALQNGLGGVVTVAAGATTFTFAAVPEGISYNVAVAQQPSQPGQTCTVSNGTGTVGTANVTSIAVTCQTVDKFAYVTNRASQSIAIYSINATSGVLSALSAFPMAGSEPNGMVFEPSKRFAYVANGLASTVSVLAANETSGALTLVATVPTPGANVFELAMDPVGRFLYVASLEGQVRAYSINQTDGTLSEVPGMPFAISGLARELKVDPTGKFVYVANETLGAVNAFAIDQTTGALSALPGSPFAAAPSVFGVEIDPAGERLYSVTRVGGAIAGFSLDSATGALTPLAGSPFPATSMSCSMVIHPRASFAFVPNSASPAGTLSSFVIAAGGALTQIQGSPVAAGAGPCSVAVDPSGGFVYVVNADSNNVSGYSINGTTGDLTAVTGSPFPALNGADTIVFR